VPHRRIKATLTVVLVVLSLVGQPLPVRAASTLAISPSRTQEASSSGVTLVLTVTGVAGGRSYTDYWAVSDPSGNNYAITTTIVAPPSGNYTVTEVYPRDFGVGAGLTWGRSRIDLRWPIFSSDLPDSTNHFPRRRWPIRNRAYGQTVLPADPSGLDQSRWVHSQ